MKSGGPYRERNDMYVKLEMTEAEIVEACKDWLVTNHNGLYNVGDDVKISVDIILDKPANIKAVVEYDLMTRTSQPTTHARR